MSYVIECEHISKTFDTPTGEFQVIKDISIQAMQMRFWCCLDRGSAARRHC